MIEIENMRPLLSSTVPPQKVEKRDSTRPLRKQLLRDDRTQTGDSFTLRRRRHGFIETGSIAQREQPKPRLPIRLG